jgi:ubiquinone/menaquinone biosynthesis C-methylase UbiE
MLKLVKRFVPPRLSQEVRDWLNTTIDERIHSRKVISVLYEPGSPVPKDSVYFIDPTRYATASVSDGLPLPPSNLRMGYAVDDDALYLQSGKKSSDLLRTVLKDHGMALEPGDAVMDWGSSTGRVLRWFAPEARSTTFWGVDQDAPSIAWAKENFSPPFRFLTCTSFPHLPFEDRTFKFIYALSVFTHIEHLTDMWLMELNRITGKGGLVIATIHDEHTLEYFQQVRQPRWIPEANDIARILKHEVAVVSDTTWNTTYTVYRSDWAQKEFGRYFDVLEVRPQADYYATAMVLRKP